MGKEMKYSLFINGLFADTIVGLFGFDALRRSGALFSHQTRSDEDVFECLEHCLYTNLWHKGFDTIVCLAALIRLNMSQNGIASAFVSLQSHARYGLVSANSRGYGHIPALLIAYRLSTSRALVGRVFAAITFDEWRVFAREISIQFHQSAFIPVLHTDTSILFYTLLYRRRTKAHKSGTKPFKSLSCS